MDISHEYIAMCRQAKEFQRGWNPHAWDYVHFDEVPQWSMWDNEYFNVFLKNELYRNCINMT